MYEELSALEEKFKIVDFPLNVIIEPGNYCNLNCKTCLNNKMTRPKGSMDIRLYKKIIDEIALENKHTRIWLDFYGEPLIQRFKLFYMINYAKNKGLTNISLNTNGTLLDEEMAEMLLDSGINFLSVDCDGFSKEVYETIRVGAKRDVLYKNLEYIINLKKLRNQKYPIIEAKIMEMDENKNEVEQVMKYWQSKGAWTTKRRLISWGGQLEGIYKEEEKDRIACGTAMGILPITWDGKAVNCVMDTDAKLQCGDVNIESIKEIWKRRNVDFLSKHMEHKWNELPEMCQKCQDWRIVGEERYDEHGNAMDKNYDSDKAML